MEETATNNKNNIFIDSNDVIYDQLDAIHENVTENDSKSEILPYQDKQEVDEDKSRKSLFDSLASHKDLISEEERSGDIISEEESIEEYISEEERSGDIISEKERSDEYKSSSDEERSDPDFCPSSKFENLTETSRYNLRSRQSNSNQGNCKYNFQQTHHKFHLEPSQESELHTSLTQMSANKGIKMFGDKALDVIMKEYQQLDNLGVFKPLMSNKINKKQKLNALNAIDLIKQKRCGKIKGRTVADGGKKRDTYSKSEVYSPALSLEGFFATLAIDAKEERHIAVADIPEAFLKADMDDLVIVKLQ